MPALFLAFAGLRPARAQDDKKAFSPQEPDQILAPIALYSDSLLSQVLMAASYPIEIVEARRDGRRPIPVSKATPPSRRCRTRAGTSA
jgi:hypothetical protein